jgi:hypothetical protein
MLNKVKAALSPLRRVLSRWLKRSFLATAFGSYRPERHYMRGSGPKSCPTHSGHTANSERA